MRLHGNLAMLLLCAFLASCVPSCSEPQRVPPGYEDAPVLFESFQVNFADTANLSLLPRGLVSLPPIGIEPVGEFDWRTHKRNDLSWWIRMERMDDILPLIDSDEEVHREVVRDWIIGWLAAHESDMKPNKGASDAMGVGIRGCVLVRYLAEVSRDDPELAGRIEKCILWTQEYLLQDSKFNLISNHAMWEAMGLFETTRVWPDTSVTRIALDRLLSAARASVSKTGTHVEHSPGYHFDFLHWLNGYVDYLKSLDMPGHAGLAKMSGINDQMKAVTYFLYDHRLNVPQIGDTDAHRYLEPPYPVDKKDRSIVLYDEEAGYAIFKDAERADAKRYVVFCIQNRSPKMPYHFHNDRMAVYYSYDGEIIFSDQGRYSYSASAMRSYVRSVSAHNTILPLVSLRRKSAKLDMVSAPLWTENEDHTLFGAESVAGDVVRNVRMPGQEPSLHVYDRLSRRVSNIILWHIGPDVDSLQYIGNTHFDSSRVYQWVLTTKNKREFELVVTVSGENIELPMEMNVIEGEKSPLMGWFCATYNSAVPIPVIKLRLDPKDEIRVKTTVTLVQP